TRDAFTSVEVVCLGGTTYMHNFVERAFGALVESLCGNSKRSMIDLGMLGFRYADTVGQIPQLSSLSLTSYNVDAFRTALMHKSAATLLDLNIGICIPKALIYDAKGNAVIYPNLRHLKVFPRDYDRTVQRVLSPGITPFPALTSLRLSLTYPFGDDVFFRGNSSTLEYLKIIIDSETAIMLSTSSAFDRPFRKLRRVDIGESHDFGDLAAIPKANIKNLLRNLMGAARGVRFSSALYLELLVTAAPRILGFEHVQDLHFYMAKLSLFDVIRVVGVLPGLTKLVCGINGVGSELGHIPAKDLPDHIVATYGTKGNSLCELSTDLARGVNIMEAANFAMLLALACPNLSKIGSARVAPPPVYYAKITKSLGRKPFNNFITSEMKAPFSADQAAQRLLTLLDTLGISSESSQGKGSTNANANANANRVSKGLDTSSISWAFHETIDTTGVLRWLAENIDAAANGLSDDELELLSHLERTEFEYGDGADLAKSESNGGCEGDEDAAPSFELHARRKRTQARISRLEAYSETVRGQHTLLTGRVNQMTRELEDLQAEELVLSKAASSADGEVARLTSMYSGLLGESSLAAQTLMARLHPESLEHRYFYQCANEISRLEIALQAHVEDIGEHVGAYMKIADELPSPWREFEPFATHSVSELLRLATAEHSRIGSSAQGL
ncbi:hypothetical protein GGI00_003970, partial [Coemansia sp. RSA 2681]